MSHTAATMIEKTDDAEDVRLMNYPDSTEDIPEIDITAYTKGKPGALEHVAKQLREATETVGFFYLKGHGIPQSLIDRMFAESRRFFALPLAEKLKVPRVDNSGYVTMKEPKNKQGNQYLLTEVQPALNESFIINRERTPDDPDVIAKKMFCSLNVWPEGIPGFRDTLLEYHATIESLGRSFLPLWATSLDLPVDYFEPMFKVPHCNLRLAHYPPQERAGTGQFGSPPHTDNCLMTFLPHGNVAGLAVRMPSGHWRKVDIIPDTILVNTGNLMLRWTNGRYLSTKHRVINTSAIDRYTFPCFFGPSFEALIECLPTCTSPDNPPKFEPITYEALRQWYYGFHN